MAVTFPKTSCAARNRLFKVYAPIIEVNPHLDRSLVSFQANKSEPFYRWFKYKEGFSSRLVVHLLTELSDKPGVLLDPFAGAGAALFAARDLGWSVVGVELLPVGFYAMDARRCAEKTQPDALAAEIKRLSCISFRKRPHPEYTFPHISITAGAFPESTEEQMAAYLAFCDKQVADPVVRKLLRFACLTVLEETSYTRKDGQYLRWDHRSPKYRGKAKFDKGKMPPFREAILQKLRRIAHDLSNNGLSARESRRRGTVDVRTGSCLEILPNMRARSVDFVITSPPYCNRYDYTRTYALELAFLGYDDDDVKHLRQELLSCTVENKDKVSRLRGVYARGARVSRLKLIEETFESQQALQEVLKALERHKAAGTLNNNNVPRMVRNYFYEMCFVVCELARILRRGGKVVMVNDNVRYAGEEVPVDLILSDFARTFGLKVRHIWTLPRGKGNSSQQMGMHGRRELRKCVYVWEKES
jgi:DNA modification methylase